MDQFGKARASPAYKMVKNFVLDHISSGDWEEGSVIPTEKELTEYFSVSRMTVSRALKELADEKILIRVAGSGTFVARQKHETTLLRVHNIVDEIAKRGGVHSCEVHLATRTKADKSMALQFGLKTGDILLHTIIVHFENGEPIQVEDRHVNALLAPDYLGVDFRTQTSSSYLSRTLPLHKAEFVIESRMPTQTIADMLAITPAESCLVLRRRTFSCDQVASLVTMWHPGKRYQFSGSL